MRPIDAKTRHHLVGVLIACELAFLALLVLTAARCVALLTQPWCGWLVIAVAMLIAVLVCHIALRRVITRDDGDGSS